jgi:hypothetical protein
MKWAGIGGDLERELNFTIPTPTFSLPPITPAIPPSTIPSSLMSENRRPMKWAGIGGEGIASEGIDSEGIDGEGINAFASDTFTTYTCPLHRPPVF